MYNIVLSHGPVVRTEYLGNDTVLYTLDNGEQYKILFVIVAESYLRFVTDSNGRMYKDGCNFDVFNERLSTDNYAQWTADNWCEIEELIERGIKWQE